MTTKQLQPLFVHWNINNGCVFNPQPCKQFLNNGLQINLQGILSQCNTYLQQLYVNVWVII